jgi:alkylation response protein AidB-like acyl-CoA dehydrogenase
MFSLRKRDAAAPVASVETNDPAPARATVADIVDADIRPNLRDIDAKGAYPETALRRLGAAGAYAHHISDAPAGLPAAIAAMSDVGETCVSSAFCMWCQDALAWYLARSSNRALAARLLTDVASGHRLGGTGLSNPMKSFSGIEALALSGDRVPGGWRVSGRLPWVSNLGDNHLFASIFAAADGRRVMAVFDCGAAGVKLTQNAHFIALEGTRTFTVLLRDVFIADADVIADDATTFVPTIRQGFVLLQLGMALGAARGAADAMDADASGRAQAAWLPHAPSNLRDRAAAIVARADDLARNAADPSRGAFLDVLRLRLDASWLALDATQALSLQLGARGYLAGCDADRRRREAQFVAIVTPSIKHITKELSQA